MPSKHDKIPALTLDEIDRHIGRHVRLTSTRNRKFNGVGEGRLERTQRDIENRTVSIVCDDGVAYSKHPLVEYIGVIEVLA